MAQLKRGDKAPDFKLQDQNGKAVKLADFKGRKLLVYFYPKAQTSGLASICWIFSRLRPVMK